MIIFIILSSLIISLVLSIFLYQKYLNKDNKSILSLKAYIKKENIEKFRLRCIKDRSIDSGEFYEQYGLFFYNCDRQNDIETYFKMYFKYLLDKKTNKDIEDIINYFFINKEDKFLIHYRNLKTYFIKHQIKESRYIYFYKEILRLYIIHMLFSNTKINKSVRDFFTLK